MQADQLLTEVKKMADYGANCMITSRKDLMEVNFWRGWIAFADSIMAVNDRADQEAGEAMNNVVHDLPEQ